MNINISGIKKRTYDAIVIGSGITGGWAAKELTQKGLNTLMLERGRNLEHVTDYHTAMQNSWEFERRNKITLQEKEQYFVQSKTYAFNAGTKHFWVNDKEHYYQQEKPFDWIRGYHLGGKSIMWGRHCYRWSDLDFEANLKDGVGIDWPIRYADLEKWYSYVEKFVGISGKKEGLSQLPDGEFLPPMELNCAELHFAQAIKNKLGITATMGRVANLSQSHMGRGPCQYRNLCARGCPFSGYFSTLSSTLPAARETKKLTVRTDAIVSEIIFDNATQKAKGVRIVDSKTKQAEEFFAKVIFLNASTLGSTFILLNSISNRFPNGLGNDSGVLGHYLMDHHHMVGASGESNEWPDQYYFGRRPGGFYIPRFRNINEQRKDYIRGYGYQGSGIREGWQREIASDEFGGDFKDRITTPGKWRLNINAFGETLPNCDNHVKLNRNHKDIFGLPTLVVSAEYKSNELAMRLDMKETAVQMLETAGFKNIISYDNLHAPGLTIHEMGTARMGRDPKNSILNSYNQVHSCKNVFVTDGACMTSSACQNPSLTYMALTARACNYAVQALKRREL